MIVPSFAALLSDTARQSSSYGTPVLSAMLINHVAKDVVLFPGPRAFGNERVILQLKPSIEALDLRAAGNAFAYLVPSLIPELLHKSHELWILHSDWLNPWTYLLRSPRLLLTLKGIGSCLRVVIILHLTSFRRASCLLEWEGRCCRLFNHILFVNLVTEASCLIAGASGEALRQGFSQVELILKLLWFLQIKPEGHRCRLG